MVELVQFPLPIPDIRLVHSCAPSADTPFVVAAFYTPNYAACADRLVESLRAHALPHAVYEVPTVHHSISRRGTPNVAYAKPNFIHFALEAWALPVLYLDVDIVVRRRPDLIFEAAATGCDFAIYNWVAEEDTDCYWPVPVGGGQEGGRELADKVFYRYSHSVDWTAPDQLVCSGAVQFWGHSAPARRLLRAWLSTISAFDRGADDLCLDFSFNNDVGGASRLRTSWLPKAYARYPWWIYDEPVLDHPDVPASPEGFRPVGDPEGPKTFYRERARPRQLPPAMPRGCMIDSETRRIVQLDGQRMVPIGRVSKPLWLPARPDAQNR